MEADTPAGPAASRDRAAKYRNLATQFRKLAEDQQRAWLRDQLLEFANHYDAIAETARRRRIGA